MDAPTFYARTVSGMTAYIQQELRLTLNADYWITQALNMPRVLVIHLAINPTYYRRLSNMIPELSMAAGLPDGQAVRIARASNQGMAIELPKPETACFTIHARHLPQRGGLRATVGVDTRQCSAIINFSHAATPHALIAGTTGSGKTNLTQVLVWSLLAGCHADRRRDPRATDAQIIVIDTEKGGREWHRFNGMQNILHPVITDVGEAHRALAWTLAELDRRKEGGYNTPRLFVVMDEFEILTDDKSVVQAISRLSGLGRELGIHMVGAIRHPTVDNIGDSTIGRNFSVRVVGRVTDHTAAKVAAGISGTGAEKLGQTGVFLLIQPGRRLQNVSAALLDTKDLECLPQIQTPPRLDLADYDLDRVLGLVKEPPSQADPLTPEQVAVALTANRGITWLCEHLNIGSTKARRLKEYTDQIRSAMEARKYAIHYFGES